MRRRDFFPFPTAIASSAVVSFAVVVFTLAVGAATPLTVRAQGATGAMSDAKPEVMAVVRRLFDGMRAGDSAMVRGVFHPQLRMLSVVQAKEGGVRLNVETSADGFVKAVGTPHPARWDERIFNERVEIDGALASVWVDYTFILGEKLSHCGVDHFLLLRGDDGKWSIISLADTRRTTGCTP
jgi:hypothetical protein